MPYLFAISRELPVQLSRLQAEWRRNFWLWCQHTPSAQDSEHLNKVFKDIERSISDHRRVDGSSKEITVHYRARCLWPFVYERATKVEALRHGLLNKTVR